jgi:hypothetical protein
MTDPSQRWRAAALAAASLLPLSAARAEPSIAELLQRLDAIAGLRALATELLQPEGDGELAAAMEFVLEGLCQNGMLSRQQLADGRAYRDPFEDMVRGLKKKS